MCSADPGLRKLSYKRAVKRQLKETQKNLLDMHCFWVVTKDVYVSVCVAEALVLLFMLCCSAESGSAGPLTEFLPQHAESFNSVVAEGRMITL